MSADPKIEAHRRVLLLAMCRCLMGADKSNDLTPIQRELLEEHLNELSGYVGFENWIEAYHGISNDEGANLEGSNERRGPRFREENIKIRTWWDYTDQIHQIVEAPSGVMQSRVLRTMERQSRDSLIALGWTPPEKK